MVWPPAQWRTCLRWRGREDGDGIGAGWTEGIEGKGRRRERVGWNSGGSEPSGNFFHNLTVGFSLTNLSELMRPRRVLRPCLLIQCNFDKLSHGVACSLPRVPRVAICASREFMRKDGSFALQLCVSRTETSTTASTGIHSLLVEGDTTPSRFWKRRVTLLAAREVFSHSFRVCGALRILRGRRRIR